MDDVVARTGRIWYPPFVFLWSGEVFFEFGETLLLPAASRGLFIGGRGCSFVPGTTGMTHQQLSGDDVCIFFFGLYKFCNASIFAGKTLLVLARTLEVEETNVKVSLASRISPVFPN